MRIVYQVTDEDIRANVIKALYEIEEDNPVEYPDPTIRQTLIDDCTEYIIDAYDRNTDERGYIPSYYNVVYDTLHDYDCIDD